MSPIKHFLRAFHLHGREPTDETDLYHYLEDWTVPSSPVHVYGEIGDVPWCRSDQMFAQTSSTEKPKEQKM